MIDFDHSKQFIMHDWTIAIIAIAVHWVLELDLKIEDF